MAERIDLSPINGGARLGQQLIDSGLNVFAIHLLVESVAKSKILEAVPEGISFTLDDNDPRHKGIRISLTRETP